MSARGWCYEALSSVGYSDEFQTIGSRPRSIYGVARPCSRCVAPGGPVSNADHRRVTTTPLWVPLVVAALGLTGAVLGTIGGVLITQRRSDRREALAWERQREREREAWAREDAARTFEHRRQAYSDFYEALRAMARRVYDHGLGIGDDEQEELPEGWQFPAFQRLQHLQMYATPSVSVKATEAYSAVWHWGHNTKRGRDDALFYDAQDTADDAEIALLQAVRGDLAIPDD